MRAETQVKIDKVIKLIEKGHKATNACKKIGLAYAAYKKYVNRQVENTPKASEYKGKETKNLEASDEVDNAIDELQTYVEKLEKENHNLKQFIKDFL